LQIHGQDLSADNLGTLQTASGANDPSHTLNAFGRIRGTPQNDRNVPRSSMNAGLVYHEPFRNRPDDAFGVGLPYLCYQKDPRIGFTRIFRNMSRST